jgi:hypothetical protein
MHYQQGGEIVPNSCFGEKVLAFRGSFASKGRNAFVQGELALFVA